MHIGLKEFLGRTRINRCSLNQVTESTYKLARIIRYMYLHCFGSLMAYHPHLNFLCSLKGISVLPIAAKISYLSRAKNNPLFFLASDRSVCSGAPTNIMQLPAATIRY